MGFSLAGHKLLVGLSVMAGGSDHWTAQDYWNKTSEDEGKIVLHQVDHDWDFYITRTFDTNDDEMIYVQPLSTVYSSYNNPGTTLLTGEIFSCSLISRPWLEDNVVQGRGDASIYIVEGNTSVTWCAQVGVSNEGYKGISALGSFGMIGDYRYVGGLPYDETLDRPQYLRNHFFTEDGTVNAITSYPGVTHVFTAQSYNDMLGANPFVEDDNITFRLFNIYLKDGTIIPGYLPDLYCLSSYRVTLEPSDVLTIYTPAEHEGTVAQDGYRVDRWAVLQNTVEL